MADGYWRIRQYSPGHKTGVTVTTIPIAHPANQLQPEPLWWQQDHALKFQWKDGTEEHYPWSSIVKAEYQPPTTPQSEDT